MKWTILFAILFLGSAAINILLYQKKQQPAPPLTPTYKVLEVFDGDSFLIEGKHEIRLRQAQAPEKNRCGYEKAKKKLTDLIKNKYVSIEYQIPDIYGRQMAIVFEGDTNVNKVLVESGLVRYHHDTTPYDSEMKEARNKAIKNKLGIFDKCESKIPKNPKCIIKGNIRQGDDTLIYFLPNCAQYKTSIISEDLGEHWFCSEKEAKAAGFIKAETCK